MTSRKCRSRAPTAKRPASRRRMATGSSSNRSRPLPTPTRSPRLRAVWPLSRSSASSMRTPSDLKQYGLDPARVEVAFRLEGGERAPAGTDRREDSDRQRSLRAPSRSEARVPRLVVSRFHLQQEHIRLARSADSRLRPRHGGWTGTHERYVEGPSRQERFGVEARVANLRSCRLRRRRGSARAPLLHSDAGHRRSGREGSGEVRSDETHRHDYRECRKLQRDAHTGFDGQRAALRQGWLAADGVHGRANPQGRRDQDGCRLPAERSLRRPRVHSHASRSQAGCRDDRAREKQRERRHGRLESGSARTSIRRKPTIC